MHYISLSVELSGSINFKEIMQEVCKFVFIIYYNAQSIEAKLAANWQNKLKLKDLQMKSQREQLQLQIQALQTEMKAKNEQIDQLK